MTAPTYPSAILSYRQADLAVHALGLCMIAVAGGILITRVATELDATLVAASIIYVVSALASNLASSTYHFAPWHERRAVLRRIDHAAIYPSITGTFTVFFVNAGTTWTYALLATCWALTALAVWNKVTNETIKSRWSTASYLGLGAIGLLAIPDLGDAPAMTPWFILAGAFCYAFGTLFYARKSLPYRYAIWHMWVNMGAICMFAGIWIALFG